jgi:hypothetical protein
MEESTAAGASTAATEAGEEAGVAGDMATAPRGSEAGTKDISRKRNSIHVLMCFSSSWFLFPPFFCFPMLFFVFFAFALSSFSVFKS